MNLTAIRSSFFFYYFPPRSCASVKPIDFGKGRIASDKVIIYLIWVSAGGEDGAGS